MAVPGPFFDFAIRLATPVEQEIEVSLTGYAAYLRETLVFVPFHLFHFFRLALSGVTLSYDPARAEAALGPEEVTLLGRSVRAVEVAAGELGHDREGEEGGAAPRDRSPEVLVPLLFEGLSAPVNILDAKEASFFLDASVLRAAAAQAPGPGEVAAMADYLNVLESLVYDRRFLARLRERARIRVLELPDTARELLLALQRFRWLRDRVDRENFRLRTVLGSFFRRHSASRYPTGGYSEITPEPGEPEHMLKTELIYMGEELGKADLFCVKYAENDILFLKRDDSSFYNCALAYVFDFSHLRLFLKDPGEMIPEYFYIALFVRNVISAVSNELPEIRTWFMVRNAPEAVREVLREYVPEGRPYDPLEIARSKSVTVYVVFNGEPAEEVRANLRLRVDIDRDTFRLNSLEIPFFRKEEFRDDGPVNRDAFRHQFGDAFCRALGAFLRAR
ncbi:MAG: hypothetical protein KA419_14775 [Acidobacteria bacterium]|nr:hypothetical protein [Acidobacteriota bacterium]